MSEDITFAANAITLEAHTTITFEGIEGVTLIVPNPISAKQLNNIGKEILEVSANMIVGGQWNRNKAKR